MHRRIRVAMLAGAALVSSGSVACEGQRRFTGPLAGTVDSLLADWTTVACEPVSALGPKGLPDRAICWQSADSAAFFYLGTGGRVVSVLEAWPADSAGHERAVQLREAMSVEFGLAVYEGDDTHGNWVEEWRGDSLCMRLYELRTERLEYQFSRQTHDYRYGCSSAPSERD